METAGRGLLATALGATAGVAVVGVLGGLAVWAFGLPPCVRGGYICGGLENVHVTAIGVLVGGYLGAVVGVAVALRARGYPGSLTTAGAVAVILLAGLAAWWGALLLAFPVAFFAGPFLLPPVAAFARWAAIRLGDAVSRSINAAAIGVLAGFLAVVVLAAVSQRHCPFHPPPACSASDLAFYAAWTGPVIYVAALLVGAMHRERAAGHVAASLVLAAGTVAVAAAATHPLVGLFLLPLALAAAIYTGLRWAEARAGSGDDGLIAARS